MDGWLSWLLVTLAAFVASVINSVAGGGTFLTFPMLTGVGHLSEKVANMTSTVGIWPGSASSVVAARAEFRRIPRGQLLAYSLISLLGGTLGSILLLKTNAKTFAHVIPWLLLFATVIFAFSKPIGRWAGHKHGQKSLPWMVLVGFVQFFVAVYGGYFGAGIGVLMLAGLSFSGLENIYQMNALKVLLGTFINGVAVVIFLLSPWFGAEPIHYRYAATMALAAALGGFYGMVVARKIKPDQLRAIILVIGAALTAYYFYRSFRA